MKSNLNANIRMTDDLERRLLAEAIETEYEYPLDAAIKSLFTKVSAFFKSPKVPTHQTARTAH